MSIEIAKAYVQIVPSTKGIKSNLEKGMGGAGEEVGKSTGQKMASSIGSGLKNVAAVGAKAIAGATVAVAGLVGASTNAYASYEQLTGGVQTLFGEISSTSDASAEVMRNAANAYKTAGLSANQYMETVTSFSASLMASLGNDAVAAASAADTAVTDMADNANKMGTSMESIQMAYQGFAKQNYTMLDNLKLGYGGTKTEMERLLSDAQKITGVEYNIDNLNDVYSALHVIQGQLGITGTTSKEASTTIEGSLNAMKSAFQNVLVGIASDGEGFDQQIDSLVDSASTFAQNIIPRVVQGVSGASELIAKLAPVIGEQIPILVESVLPNLIDAGISLITSISSGLVSALPGLLSSISQIVPKIVDAFLGITKELIPVALQMILAIAEGLGEALPTLIPTIVDVVLEIVDVLLDNIDLLIDASVLLVVGLAEGIMAAMPRLIEHIPTIVEKIVQALVVNAPKLLAAAIQIVTTLAAGIINNAITLYEAIPELIIGIKKGFLNGIATLKTIGADLIAGLWNGINDKATWLIQRIKEFAQNITDKLKDFFGIHSPSRLFRDEIGKNLDYGLALGITENVDVVEKSMNVLDKATLGALSGSVSFESQRRSDFDYDKLGDATAEAFVRAGIGIRINEREFGRIARGVIA